MFQRFRRQKTDATLVYRITNLIAGLPLHAFYIKDVTGVEHVPEAGPAIIALNHQSMLDHFISTAVVMKQTRRMVRFLAKAELFSTKWSNFLFSNWGQIPVKRGCGDGEAIETAVKVLEKGHLFGIYPEGSRSPDGILYKGFTGVARIAHRTKVPVIPVGITNSYKILPPKKLVPRFVKTELHFGEPLDLDHYYREEGTKALYVAMVDEIMSAIAQLLDLTPPREHNPRAKRFDDALRAKDLETETQPSLSQYDDRRAESEMSGEMIIDASRHT